MTVVVKDRRLSMRVLRVLVAGLVAVAGLASPVAANHQATPFHSTSTSRTTTHVCCYMRRETGDSFRMRAWFSFSTTAAANQRTNQGNGIYFTMDQHDLSHNVEAYTYLTSMPNPYFDLDDDNGDARMDEGEIVSESTSFPTANLLYNSSIYWSHWYTTSAGGGWAYDSGGGTIEFDENLSSRSCPIACDKYDTHDAATTNQNWNLNEPYPPNPQGLSSEPVDPAPASSGPIGSGPPAGRSYRVAFGDSASEVTLRADMSQGLATYARNARLLAAETIRGGGSDGVVTFNHPLSWDELATLEAAGLDVRQVELISEPDEDGLRWTIFMQNEPGRARRADGIALDAGVDLLGIVSVNVTVPNRGTLDRLQNNQDVYLVDLSITDYRRHNPGVMDIGQNDVYWLLAGWS